MAGKFSSLGSSGLTGSLRGGVIGQQRPFEKVPGSQRETDPRPPTNHAISVPPQGAFSIPGRTPSVIKGLNGLRGRKHSWRLHAASWAGILGSGVGGRFKGKGGMLPLEPNRLPFSWTAWLVSGIR